MQALLILAVVGLPIIILFDSKRRLGKYSWGWAVFALVSLFGAIGQLGNQLKAGAFERQDMVTLLLGTLVGAYAGGFTLYRVMTRRTSHDSTHSIAKTQADANASIPSKEKAENEIRTTKAAEHQPSNASGSGEPRTSPATAEAESKVKKKSIGGPIAGLVISAFALYGGGQNTISLLVWGVVGIVSLAMLFSRLR